MAAEAKGFLRVIEEAGEDYLYPEAAFLPLPLPRPLEGRLARLAEERSDAGIA